VRNSEIADALAELSVLYELDGADRYRVLAYRQAANAVRESPLSIEQLSKEGRSTEVQGIGKTLAEKIDALIRTGEIPAAAKLKRRIPSSLVALTRIPRLGAKTVRRLHDELGVETLEDLKRSAEEQRIRELKGLGPKVEENVLATIGAITEEPVDRRLLSDVLPLAQELVADLAKAKGTESVEVAGSARRWADTCKDIDLIAVSDDPVTLAAGFAAHDLIDEGDSGGPAGAHGVTYHGIRVDLRIGPAEVRGNLLQHFTGSAEHSVQLREQAVSQSLSVSEHGITDTESGEVHRCATEAEVYERLGFSYIEPELREGRGELRASRDGTLPRLIEQDDIRGDLHCHTTLSDGHNTLGEMAAAARERGYAYLAVTDHSASHGFGNHVTDDQLRRRIEEVRELNRGTRGFRVLAGSEVNIGTDGSLDYPDELLAELDWVIASVHTSFGVGERRMTERVLAAMEHPHVDCIGHLTGRMLLRREGYSIDVERVVEGAARTGTMLEINGNPRRRDMSDRSARLAAEAGVMIAVNTDAHRVATMENMAYGIATARRAWLTPDQVANTRPWRAFSRLRKRARS
jgi:DNA polymerase (family 10)